MKIYPLLVASLLLAGLFSSTSYAENRALLFATTKYQNPKYDLPGIEIDLANMEKFARKLGFTDEQILTLSGEDVTANNVRKAFKSHIGKGVGPTDNVLVYYSGHGLQIADKNNDEADSLDEAIALYDLEPIAGGYNGVLLDDELERMLQALPSNNVTVIVDACHSGTVTRSFTQAETFDTLAYGTQEFAVKALPIRSVPASRSMGVEKDSNIDTSVAGVVTLSAAQDDQLSYASKRGSLFTLAMTEALDQVRSNPTPSSLYSLSTRILAERLDKKKRFNPNLTGDSTRFDKPIKALDSRERGEVNWNDMLQTTHSLGDLTLTGIKNKLIDGELLSINMEIPSDGYLNVISVDSDDNMVLLFPNDVEKNNKVGAGRLTLPGDLPFEWVAQAPWGRNMLSVVFSESPLNLFETSLQRNAEGAAIGQYLMPSEDGLRAIKKMQSDPATARAATAFFTICKSASECQ